MESVGAWLVDAMVIIANGFLVMGYWLADRLPLLVALACLPLMLAFDQAVAVLAAHAPSRAGQAAPATLNRSHHLMTLLAGGLWLLAGALFPPPVPWLGTAMWLTALLLLLLLPSERVVVLWRVKVSILTYSLALLGFRWYLWQIGQADPYQWATVVGSVGEAQRIIGQNQGLFLTIGTWIAWFALPAAHVGYVVQRLTTNPMSLRGPRQAAAEVLEAIRMRSAD